MDKEEIEKGKAHLEWLLDNGILSSEDELHIENILKYINNLEITNKTLDTECSRLEKKESILDKVTDFTYKIATENAEKYNSENQKEVDFSEWNLAIEILNIIEGEKENG